MNKDLLMEKVKALVLMMMLLQNGHANHQPCKDLMSGKIREEFDSAFWRSETYHLTTVSGS